jgi:hypothetical protein
VAITFLLCLSAFWEQMFLSFHVSTFGKELDPKMGHTTSLKPNLVI